MRGKDRSSRDAATPSMSHVAHWLDAKDKQSEIVEIATLLRDPDATMLVPLPYRQIVEKEIRKQLKGDEQEWRKYRARQNRLKAARTQPALFVNRL